MADKLRPHGQGDIDRQLALLRGVQQLPDKQICPLLPSIIPLLQAKEFLELIYHYQQIAPGADAGHPRRLGQASGALFQFLYSSRFGEARFPECLGHAIDLPDIACTRQLTCMELGQHTGSNQR